MKAENGCRLALPLFVGRCLCALALAVVWTGQVDAAKLPQWGTSGVSSNGGKSFAINPGGGDLRIPIKTPAGGWQTAGNYGVQNGATGTTFRLGADGQVFRSMPDGTTVKYPMHYEHPTAISGADLAAAVGAMLPGPLGIACMVGCGYLKDWLQSGQGRINEGTGALEKQSDAASYQITRGNGVQANFPTLDAGCAWAAAGLLNQPGTVSGINTTPGQNAGECRIKDASGNEYGALWQAIGSGNGEWMPATMDDIAPYMSPRPDARVIKELLEKGADIPLPKTGGTVTGPSSIAGPTTTTINADGSKTVTSTTHNFSNVGNTVSNTSSVTTTTVYNIDNSVRSSTSTTTTPTDDTAQPGEQAANEEAKDPCEGKPDRLGCVEIDTPEGEIPKDTKTITYAEEGGLGSGSCPQNKVWASQTLGKSYELIDWGTACGWAAQMRWLVYLLGAWAAMWILIPANNNLRPA